MWLRFVIVAGGGGVAGAAPTSTGILRVSEVSGVVGGMWRVQEGHHQCTDIGSVFAPSGGGGRCEEEDVPDLSAER